MYIFLEKALFCKDSNFNIEKSAIRPNESVKIAVCASGLAFLTLERISVVSVTPSVALNHWRKKHFTCKKQESHYLLTAYSYNSFSIKLDVTYMPISQEYDHVLCFRFSFRLYLIYN